MSDFEGTCMRNNQFGRVLAVASISRTFGRTKGAAKPMRTPILTVAPAGTWNLDPVHSRVDFEVRYLAGTFKGEFHEIGAELTVDGERASLEGTAKVAVDGELTIKGATKPVAVTGTATAPIADPYGNDRIGLKLTTKIDRTDFGVNWNNPLPSGEPALANDVTILAVLQFVKPGGE